MFQEWNGGDGPLRTLIEMWPIWLIGGISFGMILFWRFG